MIGNSNDETNFWHKLLVTEQQVAKVRKATTNNLSADTE